MGGQEPTGPAEHLVRRGTELAAGARLAEAAVAYEQAARLHRRAGRVGDEARTLTLLATTRRLAGDLTGAAEAATRACRLARDEHPVVDLALTEAAEIALAAGDAAAAARMLSEVLDGGAAAPPSPPRWRLLRTRALAHIAAQDAAAADRDLADAAAALTSAGDRATAATVLVERVTAMHSLGDRARFRTALGEARRRIDDRRDPVAAGELDLAEGAEAVASGRLADAERLARRARDRALAGTAPLLYIGASVAIAELADLAGNRVEAYGALATGWATVGDLMGRDRAAAVFRPRMQALAASWGAEGFASVRRAYEAGRRRDLGLEGG
jgi:tetratricopeptide (TPR) repeat protein